MDTTEKRIRELLLRARDLEGEAERLRQQVQRLMRLEFLKRHLIDGIALLGPVSRAKILQKRK
jgi:hypothetical protein